MEEMRRSWSKEYSRREGRRLGRGPRNITVPEEKKS